MNRQSLSRHFRQFLPRTSVIDQVESLRAYECDGLSAYRQLPLLVVLPETVEQVRRALRVCRELGVPVVSRGAGTGLSGGALPHAQGIVLSLAKMNQVLEIDPINRTARVQPGVRNLAISEAVKHLGLFYAPDPSSQIACSIGGNVAENAGGVHCLKYGLTVHNIAGLKIATIDGDLVTLGGAALDSAGFDLLALMVGSEGMLAVVVEVTVKLLPCPESASVLLGAFNAVENAADSVASVIAAGIIPAGVEMMDNPAIRAAEDFAGAGYPRDAEAILLCELDGAEGDVGEQVGQVREILRRHGAAHIRVAADPVERARLWSGRKGAFPAIGRISPDYYCSDGTIPRRVLTEIGRLSGEYGLRVANVFHAGDGNLHPLILYDAARPGELQRTEELGARILELCIEVGGTITGEHGVGVEKIGSMCVQFHPAERAQLHAVREAFDPGR
ncbi:MAG: FAD-binding protein, partial [Gammaproteobacteria bacterium]|nr:FAD-binding protein [Gammaproteobacteria bacterium]